MGRYNFNICTELHKVAGGFELEDGEHRNTAIQRLFD